MLISLLSSIFYGDYDDKLRNFEMFLFFLMLSSSITIVVLIFTWINSLMNYSISVSNIIAVLIISSTLLLLIFSLRYFEAKCKKRFDLLYAIKDHDEEPGFIKRILRKHKKKIWYSGTLGLFLAIFGIMGED